LNRAERYIERQRKDRDIEQNGHMQGERHRDRDRERDRETLTRTDRYRQRQRHRQRQRQRYIEQNGQIQTETKT